MLLSIARFDYRHRFVVNCYRNTSDFGRAASKCGLTSLSEELMRRIKPWGKKRGDRRTGSQVLGSLGEALFFTILFLLGSLALILLLTSTQLHSWPARNYFPELYYVVGQAKVVETRLDESVRGERALRYRPGLLVEWRDGPNSRSAWIGQGEFSQDREAALTRLDRFHAGESYPCWFLPGQADSIDMIKPSRVRFWLALVSMVAFVLIGGVRMIFAVLHVGASPERRAAMANRAAQLDFVGEVGRATVDYPHVPDDADMKNSPGVMLKYRLPIVRSPILRVLGAALFCLVWSGIAVVFVQVIIRSIVQGRPEWMLALVTLVFLAVAAWSIRYFVRQLLFVAGVGPTSVEISDHPLFPGCRYQVFFTQAGRVAVEKLELALVCDEEATYRQGTDVRTEVRRVIEIPVFRQQSVGMKPGFPFEFECELEVPPEVMHSFRSNNNSVQWKLMVEGESAGWSFQRDFPVVVFPKRLDRIGA